MTTTVMYAFYLDMHCRALRRYISTTGLLYPETGLRIEKSQLALYDIDFATDIHWPTRCSYSKCPVQEPLLLFNFSQGQRLGTREAGASEALFLH